MKPPAARVLLRVLLLAACFPATPTVAAAAPADAGMAYVEVCDRRHDCKRFSRLIMGTDHLVQGDWTGDRAPAMDAPQVQALLDEAAKLGINLYDTAPIYVGGVEKQLGQWMKSRQQAVTQPQFYADPRLNPDRKLYALSKGGFPFDLYYLKRLPAGTHAEPLKLALQQQGILGDFPTRGEDVERGLSQVPPGTYASRLYGSQAQITSRLEEELERSASNLDGFLTVYLMHRDDGDFVRFDRVPRPQTPVSTILDALATPRLASRFWALGWSNWETARVDESLALARLDARRPVPRFNSAYFSLFEMSRRTIHAGGVQVTHQEMRDPGFQQGILQNPYSPLGGFSVLDQPEPRWENARKLAKAKHDQGDPYWVNVYPSIFTDANQARYERAVAFTARFNAEHQTDYTVDQVINAYALAHRRTDFLTIGPITVAQLRRTVASLKLARMLTKADLEYLYQGASQQSQASK